MGCSIITQAKHTLVSNGSFACIEAKMWENAFEFWGVLSVTSGNKFGIDLNMLFWIGNLSKIKKGFSKLHCTIRTIILEMVNKQVWQFYLFLKCWLWSQSCHSSTAENGRALHHDLIHAMAQCYLKLSSVASILCQNETSGTGSGQKHHQPNGKKCIKLFPLSIIFFYPDGKILS